MNRRVVSCASKQRHVSLEAAHFACKVYGTEFFDTIYHCQDCNGYHIATADGAQKIKARRTSEKMGHKKNVGKFKDKRSR